MAVGATFSLVGGINDIGMEERRRVHHVTGDESPTASLAIKCRTAGGPPRSGPPHWRGSTYFTVITRSILIYCYHAI